MLEALLTERALDELWRLHCIDRHGKVMTLEVSKLDLNEIRGAAVRENVRNYLRANHYKVESELVTVTVSSRHIEDYELINHADGTRWRVRNGRWVAAPQS